MQYITYATTAPNNSPVRVPEGLLRLRHDLRPLQVGVCLAHHGHEVGKDVGTHRVESLGEGGGDVCIFNNININKYFSYGGVLSCGADVTGMELAYTHFDTVFDSITNMAPRLHRECRVPQLAAVVSGHLQAVLRQPQVVCVGMVGGTITIMFYRAKYNAH